MIFLTWSEMVQEKNYTHNFLLPSYPTGQKIEMRKCLRKYKSISWRDGIMREREKENKRTKKDTVSHSF